MKDATKTRLKFLEYERYICKKMGFSKSVWRVLQNDIINIYGLWDSEVDYAGRGDDSSEDETLSSMIIPGIIDGFIYYVHDAIYHLIENCHRYSETFMNGIDLSCYSIGWKNKADLIMKHMMEFKDKGFTIVDDIYYFFVKWLG